MAHDGKQVTEDIRESLKLLRQLYKNAPDEEVKLTLSDVLDRLMNALGLYQEVLEEKKKVEEKAKEKEQWSENESKHELFRFFSGSTIMVPKEGNQSAYLKEWYCKHCFDNKKKSHLQVNATWNYFCPECKTPYSLTARDQEKYNEDHSISSPPAKPQITLGR